MLTQKELRRLFDYKEGKLIRKITVSSNGLKGSVAGAVKPRRDGYLSIKVKGKLYSLHRVIYAFHYRNAIDQIDHINNNKLDNRIENLRAVTSAQNGKNRSICCINTSGVKGVSWNKARKMYEARIREGDKYLYSGLFWDIEVAAQMLRIKRLELHGEYANNG